MRERMPFRRGVRSATVDIQGHRFVVSVGCFPDGRLGEIWTVPEMKRGTSLSEMVAAFSMSVSIGLQSGVELCEYTKTIAAQFPFFEELFGVVSSLAADEGVL
jgi:hypothetical protein